MLFFTFLKRLGSGRCLHSIDGPPNPYVTTLSLIARTLEEFDDDNLIPCYGFGDVTTRDEAVFSFFKNNQPARGLPELLLRYQQLLPSIKLSGPTSFAPLIHQAIRDVFQSGMQFHLLLIIADGQISNECIQETMNAVVLASNFPLAIAVVGVGDGPWAAMRYFDDNLPSRRWDNFQFVEFNRVNNPEVEEERREASFALNTLMEVPDQYKIASPMIGKQNMQKVQNIVRSKLRSYMLNPPYSTF